MYLCFIIKNKTDMRAILIDPANKSIKEVEHNGDYKEIYKLIDCECFTCPVTLDNGDSMYCDDEGLFKEQEGGIIMEDWAYPILGKILLLGTDFEDGESIDAKSQIETLKSSIYFIDKASAERYRAKFN